MHRSIAVALAGLALMTSAVVRADDSAPAAQAAPAASGAEVAAASASAPAAPKQHCWKEYRVGSNFPVTHCEPTDESEAQRQERIRNVENAATRNNNMVRGVGAGS